MTDPSKPLLDAQYEVFCHKRVESMNQTDAHEAAGFKRHDGNASRVGKRPEVIARIAYLQGLAAEIAIATRADVVKQLNRDRDFARTCKAPGAAVTATMGIAKVLDLLTEHHEHTGAGGGPIETKDVTRETIEREVADQFADPASRSSDRDPVVH